ncbi:MAG: hypothetical protein ACOYYI_08260 [Chloroflexota bacterium]
MNNLYSPIKKKLSIAQAAGWSLWLTLVIGSVGTLFLYLPDFNFLPAPVFGLITVWGLSIAIGIAGFWNARNPHWITQFIVLFSLTTLFLTGAIQMLRFYLSGWFWYALLVSAYLFVWSLPLLNLCLANFFHKKEQAHPQTWLGRYQGEIVLMVILFGIVLLWIFPRERTFMLFIGSLFLFVSISGGQYFAYEVWKTYREQQIQKSAQ